MLLEDASPYFYYFARTADNIVIEAAPGQTAAALATAVREAIHRKAPGLTIISLNTLQQQMSIPLFAWRASSGLFGVSAMLGIFVTAVAFTAWSHIPSNAAPMKSAFGWLSGPAQATSGNSSLAMASSWSRAARSLVLPPQSPAHTL